MTQQAGNSSPISDKQFSLLLTCTIDVKGIANMERNDTALRLKDYKDALTKWLDDPWVNNIILVENSGYPLDELRLLADRHQYEKSVEFLSFNGQDFPRQLGKGYGEAIALRYVYQHSQQLQRTGRFVKINGRYFVPNLRRVLSGMHTDTAVFFTLNRGMSFSDSRVFGGDLAFLGRVGESGLRVDETLGYWFEHALAAAGLQAISDGCAWRFITNLPVVQGLSGTFNGPYKEPYYKLWLKGRVHALKQRLLAL